MAVSPRITAESVRALLGKATCLDANDIECGGYLTIAHTLVDSLLLDCGYTDEQLEVIEKLLAAHFVAIADRQVASENVAGEYSVKYDGSTDTGLGATLWGQQAKIVDTCGRLATLGKAKARFTVNG